MNTQAQENIRKGEKMSVKLIYKHQQKTYELMKDSLEKNGRANETN